MGSRQLTEGEGARLPALSRRAMLVGTSTAAAASGAKVTAPLATEAQAFNNPTRLYEHWISLDKEVERLLAQWGDVEAWLMREHNWYRLSEAERSTLPEGRTLGEIDERLNSVFAERDGLLGKLPTRGARTVDVVAARLQVAERLIYRDDHPEAHAMIVGSRRDLNEIVAAISGAGAP